METFINKKRAEYLLKNRLQQYGGLRYSFLQKCDSTGKKTYPDGITPGENEYIRRVWRLMDGNTCYMDALNSIKRGYVKMSCKNCRSKYEVAVERTQFDEKHVSVCPTCFDQEVLSYKIEPEENSP